MVSICVFQAGTTDNVIPQTAQLRGTARSLTPEVRDLLERRLREVVEGTASSTAPRRSSPTGATTRCPCNHDAGDRLCRRRSPARSSARSASTRTSPPVMGAEDFSYMLEARPGAFIFVGNGDSAGLHHPAYDFNDEVIPIGTSYWVRLVETAMAG